MTVDREESNHKLLSQKTIPDIIKQDKEKGNQDNMGSIVRKIGATLFGIGFIPGAPGTYASLATVIALWFLRPSINGLSANPLFGDAAMWLIALALVGISIFFSSQPQKDFGDDDPGPVVIDEVAGQFITFLCVPISLPVLILGFLLFRFFDIIKPYPVHLFEQLDRGVGITMDDVAAGLYANISLLFIVGGYHLVRAHL